MEATKVWFDKNRIYIETDSGETLSQSLKYYPRLRYATDGQRAAYRLGPFGIHWKEIDEDVSYESFTYDEEPEAPNAVAAVFERFPEINVSKLAQRMGIPQSVLAAYLCGAKIPSDKRKKEIEKALHDLGKELMSVQMEKTA